MTENEEIRSVHKIPLLIGITGFLASLYALYLHISNAMQPGHGFLCDINNQINCSAVIGSHYGSLLHIPLGSYGMTYFIGVMVYAFLPKILKVNARTMSVLGLFLATIGLGSVLAFMYISYAIIHIMCPTCTVVHILVILFFLTQVFYFFRSRKNGNVLPNILSNYFAIFLILGVPPLAIGLITPIVIEKFFPSQPTQDKKINFANPAPLSVLPKNHKTATENVKKSLNKSHSESPLKKVFTTFHKSNFVGNGEDYRKGSNNAPVVVQMFSDFGCPHCRAANKALSEAQKNFGPKNVVIVYRFFPLSNKCNAAIQSPGWYPYTCILTEAARCAGAQGAFLAMKDWAYQGQEWDDQARKDNFSMTGLIGQATRLGLNAKAFETCLKTHQELAKIKADAAVASLQHISGTPLIMINGIEYKGEPSATGFYDAFQQAKNAAEK